MKIINVVLVLVLLLGGLNKEVFAMYQEQNSSTATVKTSLLQIPSRQARLSEPAQASINSGAIDQISSACADYAEGEIIVKMKPAAAQASSSMATKLLTTGLSFATTVNSEDSADVESYLEKNIPGLGDISLDKAIKSSDALSGLPLANFSSSTNVRVVQTTPKTKLQIKAESLQQKYGFNRTYRITSGEKDCLQLERLIEQIDANSNVEYAEPNRKVTVQALPVNDPLYLSHGEVWGLPYDELWGLKQIKADQAWDVSTGKGVVVAVIDTGVDYNHPDLWANIWVDPNLVSDRNKDGKVNLDDADLNGDKTISENEIIPSMFGYDFAYDDYDPQDVHGHGTHVAGTIAAVRNNARGIVGVAPDAKILILRGLDNDGSGSYDGLASAVKYAADLLANNPNIQSLVTNNSWGGEGSSQTIADAFDYAKELGVISIAAAGNSSVDAKGFIPASLPSVITVAASRVDSGLSVFSNFGLSVDVAAPGGGLDDRFDDNVGNILSTVNINSNLCSPEHIVQGDKDRTEYAYGRLAGTSMASPHIAGVAALIKSLHPDYGTEDIRAVLRNTASPINSNQIDGGISNALNAVKLTEVPPKAFLHPVREEYITGYISLQGTASSKNFLSYTLEYSTDVDSQSPIWYPIQTVYKAVEDGLILNNFDSSKLPDGKLLIRLRVKDQSGEESQDTIDINVDNIQLVSPLTNDALNDPHSLSPVLFTEYQTTTVANMLMPVTVRTYGQTRRPVVINVIDASTGISITPALISYTGSITDTIGYVNTKSLPHPGTYNLQIVVNNRIAASTYFIYEPRLVNLQPLRITDHPDYLLSEHFRVADLNNDGVDEILIGEDKVRVLSNSKVTLEHTFSNGFEAFDSPLVADLDGDGNKELISHTYSPNESVHKISVIDKAGNELPQWEQYLNPHNEKIYHRDRVKTMIGDVNADNRADIISILGLNTIPRGVDVYLTTSYLGSDNLVHQESHLLDHSYRLIDSIIGDFDGNSKDEIAILVNKATADDHLGGSEIMILIFSLNGKLLKTIATGLKSVWYLPGQGLTAADIDQDADLELIVGGYPIGTPLSIGSGELSLQMTAFNHDGSLVYGWPFITSHSDWFGMTSPTIGDLNNDGFPEIIFGASSWRYDYEKGYYIHTDHIFVFDKDGQLLPNYPITRETSERDALPFSAGTSPSSMIIADVDNDGQCDIVTAIGAKKDDRGVVFAYKYDATPIKGFPLYAGNTFSLSQSWFYYQQTPSSMAVGNFDKDPGMELVFVDTLKYVYVYNLDVPATAKVEWGMLRSDVKNTGVYYKKGKPRPKADLSSQVAVYPSGITTGNTFFLGLLVRNNLDISKNWTGTAYGVVATMDIPYGLTPVGVNNNCTFKDNKATCNFDTLLPAAIKFLYLQFKADNDQFADIEIPISATVSARSRVQNQISTDPDSANNRSTVKITVNQKRADLSTKISIDKAKVLPGDLVKVDLQAINNLNVLKGWFADAYDVISSMAIPAGLTPVTVDSNCYIKSDKTNTVNSLACFTPILKAGDTQHFYNTFKTDSNVKKDTSIIISSTSIQATSTIVNQITIDPNSSNDNSTVNLLVAPRRADLSITTFTTNKTTYLKGEDVLLTVIANNNIGVGNYAAYGVVLKIPQPEFLTFDPSKQDPGQNCALVNKEIVCQLSNLPLGAVVKRTIKFSIPVNSTVGARALTIGATSLSATSTTVNQLTIDPNLSNNTKSTSISTVQYADLIADIKASRSSYRYNENIPLILSVQNKQDLARSYISDAYNVITRMVIPPSYDYIGDNPDCAMNSTRELTCNFSTLKSNATTTRIITLKPLILKPGLKVLNFSLNASSQATVPAQKTIDPLVLNNSKNLVLTAQ